MSLGVNPIDHPDLYDSIILAGRVSIKMAPIIRRLYDSWLGLALNTLRDDEIAGEGGGTHAAPPRSQAS